MTSKYQPKVAMDAAKSLLNFRQWRKCGEQCVASWFQRGALSSSGGPVSSWRQLGCKGSTDI